MLQKMPIKNKFLEETNKKFGNFRSALSTLKEEFLSKKLHPRIFF